MGEPIAFPYEDPEFAADPYPFYRTLREEGAVRRVVTVRGLDAWLITRYEDGLAALSDPRLGSDLRDADDPRLLEMIPSRQREFMRSMIRVDPPDHTRLRRLVAKAFTARRVAELRPRIQQIADGLLDVIAPTGHADLVEDFALPLPVTVISELLGVPGGDREGFQEWTNVMLARPPGPADHAEVEQAWQRMWSYLKRLLTAKRARPGDDVLSALIAARDDERRLDEDELIAMALLLLVAGYVTTVNLIGTGIVALLTHPAQLRCCSTSRRCCRARSRSCCATTGRSARRCASCSASAGCTARRSCRASASSCSSMPRTATRAPMTIPTGSTSLATARRT
jgi:cytochrome P450